MPSSGILRPVDPVRSDVSDEPFASIRGFLRRVLQLLATANVVPSSPTVVTLMMESIHSIEMSQHSTPEGDIFHS
jgi:hypothetical protein